MNPSRAKSEMPERDIRRQNITVKIGLKFCKLILNSVSITVLKCKGICREFEFCKTNIL